MRAWRHDIHRHPEIAFQETRTAAFVEERIRDFARESGAEIEVASGLAGTGIVATLHGDQSTDLPQAHPGQRVIGLRAELDALPMAEANDFAHRSRHDGCMHACGHDGHTAMLLGALRHLAHTRRFAGTVHCIFQPAEENEGGARVMVEEAGLFERFPVEAIFGMHNWPGLPAGQIAVQPGPVMAAYDHFDLRLTGKGGHAAMPHQGRDPIVLAAQTVQAFQTIASRGDPLDSVALSVTQINAGDAYNIIPNEAVLKGTVRSFRPETQQAVEARMREIVAGLCAAAGAEFAFEYQHGYPATVNSARESEFVARYVADRFGSDVLVRDYPPSTGSEDFAFMLQKRPGCYVKLGAGVGPGLHNPRYDFNDEILGRGAAYWVGLVERYLHPDHSTDASGPAFFAEI